MKAMFPFPKWPSDPWLINHGGDPTLPETNMAPENRPLEKDIPIGNHHF